MFAHAMNVWIEFSLELILQFYRIYFRLKRSIRVKALLNRFPKTKNKYQYQISSGYTQYEGGAIDSPILVVKVFYGIHTNHARSNKFAHGVVLGNIILQWCSG